VFEFARGVERVDIDHGVAGAQHCRHCHRHLQDIGHHHRDPITLLEAKRLQPGADPVERLSISA
jgi:hypothetical protein